MKINVDVYSDIHIDSWLSYYPKMSVAAAFIETDIGPNDIAIVAGDCGNGKGLGVRVEDALLTKYKSVFRINGNHCHYFEGVLPEPSISVIDFMGLRIVGCTLWTNFRDQPKFGEFSEYAINDFTAIKGMKWEIMKELHDRERDLLIENRDADIVVTHFPPLIFSVNPNFAGDRCNPYFVNDDPDLVRAIKPKLWIHGHTHSPFDYNFEGVRVVANPIGYAGENFKAPQFPAKRVEMDID